MKVTIVGGAGVVGSSTAFRIAQDGKASEIILIDRRHNVAEAHALDIEQAVVGRSTTKVRVGEMDDTRASDFIVMSLGFPQQLSVMSRSEFLSVHLPPVMDMAEQLAGLSPSGIWFVATSPVDPLVYIIHQTFSIPRSKVLGLNRNDTIRFRWAIARVLSVPSTAVEAFVLGEHGETQVPVFSHIRINGESWSLTGQEEEQVRAEISGFYVRFKGLQSGRTAGWASAESTGDIFSSVVSGDGLKHASSTPLEGEYGLSGVSLGVPVVLGPSGVQKIVELDLTTAEREALGTSARKIKEEIRQGKALLTKPKV